MRNGAVLFSGDDVRDGQAVFLKYGLMDNGTIWGHGAYLGPDFSAQCLHSMGYRHRGSHRARAVSADLCRADAGATARRYSAEPRSMKNNRYDPVTQTLAP